MSPRPRLCPTHHVPLVVFCPACRGGAGGKASTPAQKAAGRANVAKARLSRPDKRRWTLNGAPLVLADFIAMNDFDTFELMEIAALKPGESVLYAVEGEAGTGQLLTRIA